LFVRASFDDVVGILADLRMIQMSRHLRSFIAIALIPVCLGATISLVRVIQATANAETIWVASLSGAACWLIIFLLLPKPMWIYVVGHEFTHVLWTWLFGGKVKRFRATSKGGHVVVTKDNFLISLAPYFFPIYVTLVLLVFILGNLIWNWLRYAAVFHLLIGAAYAFHVTLTWTALKTLQPDIARHGYLFSAVVIWLGNVAVLLVGIPILTSSCGILTAFGWCWLETGHVVLKLAQLF
jgi:hypothetical protein